MPVSYVKRDHVGIVTLSRPGARNAWGPDFNEGLARHFAAMEDDDDVRCAVLTGRALGSEAMMDAAVSRAWGSRRRTRIRRGCG